MNRSRVILLGLAAVAAIVAAFLVRGLLGGGTEKSAAATAPHPVNTVRVLVAASNIGAGTRLKPELVRWQVWPRSSVDSTFITSDGVRDLSTALKNTVARMPLIAGQPINTAGIVHSDNASFMSAQLAPGMRAVSIAISATSSAGGFILPNDRVDVLMTRPVQGANHDFATTTILSNVRVLAIGTTYKSDSKSDSGDDNSVMGKTATLELTPRQAEIVARSSSAGSLALSLRPLGSDNAENKVASTSSDTAGNISVIRYGIASSGSSNQGE